MTSIASSLGSRAGWRAGAVLVAALLIVSGGSVEAEELILRLKASPVGAGQTSLRIELLRWSTDAEREGLLTVLTAPPPAPAAAPAGGRGGRGRGGGAAPPASPMARLTTAIRAAPTVGYIWGDGPTGYSIRYAWRSASADGRERLVLVTDRRVGPHILPSPATGAAAEAGAAAAALADADFTLIEARLDAKGAGEAKTSLAAAVVVDPAAKTLALEGYDAQPVQLKVSR